MDLVGRKRRGATRTAPNYTSLTRSKAECDTHLVLQSHLLLILLGQALLYSSGTVHSSTGQEAVQSTAQHCTWVVMTCSALQHSAVKCGTECGRAVQNSTVRYVEQRTCRLSLSLCRAASLRAAPSSFFSSACFCFSSCCRALGCDFCSWRSRATSSCKFQRLQGEGASVWVRVCVGGGGQRARS